MATEQDDIFDDVKAPTWAPLQAKVSDVSLEGFFPELPEVFETVLGGETFENPEDISRMAMFGNRPPTKRRSQIRKEEAAKKNDTATNEEPSKPVNRRSQSVSNRTPSKPVISRTSSTISLPNGSRPNSLPIGPRPAPPLPKTQPKRQSVNTPVQPNRSRTMTRNSAIVQRPIAPSPIPSQGEFNRALKNRPASLGRGAAVVHSTPRNTVKRVPSSGKQNTPNKPQLPPSQSINKPQPKPQVPASSRVRAPVTVTSSPKPLIAFGSVVKPKPETPRSSVIRQQTEPKTPTNRTLNLRSYPTPSGVTPARGLTVPRTPVVMRRTSQDRLRVVDDQKNKAIVERLYQPKKPTITNASIYQTPISTIPNTFTHGMLSAKKSRKRLTLNQDR